MNQRKPLLTRDRILFLIVLALAAILTVTAPHFLTAENLQINARYVVEIGFLIIPMTMIIIIKGIDLSVGSIVALSTVALGLSFQVLHLPIIASLLIAVAVAVLCGLFNGIIITRGFRVPDMLVTLSTLAIYRGVAQGIGSGQRVYLYEEPIMRFLGEGRFLGLPIGMFVLLPAILVAGVALDRAIFGRQIYAMGNNEVAARFAGIRADRLRLFVYVFAGLCSGLTAVFLTARLGTARETAGLGMEFEAITAVVVGGTAIAGGEGTVWGSFLGLLLVTMLKNGLNLLGVPAEIQQIIIGGLLILTVLMNETIRMRMQRNLKAGPQRSGGVGQASDEAAQTTPPPTPSEEGRVTVRIQEAVVQSTLKPTTTNGGRK